MTVIVKPSGPFAYYKLDAGLTDIIGGRDAVQYPLAGGTPTFVAGGIIDNCLVSGPDIYCYCTGNDWALSTTIGFSVRMWIMSTAKIACSVLVGANVSGILPAWAIFPNGANTRFYLDHFQNYVQKAATLSDGNWHMLIGIYDYANDTIRLVIDGISSAPVTVPKMVWTWGGSGLAGVGLTFGYNPTAFDNFLVDEIAIYKDHVLTTQEISDEWNGGAGRTWPW